MKIKRNFLEKLLLVALEKVEKRNLIVDGERKLYEAYSHTYQKNCNNIFLA
jgi:hypothetical protein